MNLEKLAFQSLNLYLSKNDQRSKRQFFKFISAVDNRLFVMTLTVSLKN